MILLRRAISAQQFLPPYQISRKCLLLPRSITAFQQFSLYSSTTKYTSTHHTLKAEQPKKPRTQKPPSPSSSSTWSQRVKKQAEAIPTWPRPSDIPYQARVANSVNVIGYIQMPVLFHATPDGKHKATTFIAQENNTNSKTPSSNSPSLTIPIVFEGDLAHIVACHVKQNDCVYVTGKLCVDPLPFDLTESQGKLHIMGQEINFVQGLERRVSDRLEEKKEMSVVDENGVQNVGTDNAVKKDVGDKFSSVEIDTAVNNLWENLVTKPSEWFVITSQDDGLKGAIEGFERKSDGKTLDLDDSTPMWVYKKLEYAKFDDKFEQGKIKQYNRSSDNLAGAKDGESVSSPWQDLLENPKDWSDNREKKSSGSLKATFPDFKHKTNGTALWLNSAPKWVLPRLQQLGIDVPDKKGQEDQWKSLIENPDKWWDNRSSKINKKSPDFKHKETGEGIWLDSSPEWVLSRFPPSEGE